MSLLAIEMKRLARDAMGITQVKMNYLGQKVGDKFTKLSKIAFSMEFFTTNILQFFNEKRQNLTFGFTAGY